MSCHVIYYDNGAKLMRPVSTREEYIALRDSEFQRHLVQKVREGDVNSKKKLVQFNYSCLPTPDGKLAGSKIASCSVMMDIDGVQEEDMAGLCERILGHKGEIGLLMLEISARNRGYHLVFHRRPELSQEENLSMAAEVLGVQYDAAAKDITRVFFTTTAEDLLFLDDELFDQEAAPIVLQPPVSKTTISYSEEYRGIPFSEIISKYWELNGGEPELGERNCRLFELCCTLAPITNYSPEFLASIIPDYGLEESEIMSICTSACKADRRGGMPFRLRQVLKTLSAEKQSVVCTEAPPALPKKLPKLLKLLSSKVPNNLKPAVCENCFGALACYTSDLRFRYWDNVVHEPTFCSVLVAEQSSGKSCIRLVNNEILKEIQASDLIQREKEARWKMDNPPTKASREPRPEGGFPIQILSPDATPAAFLRRLLDCEKNGHKYLYCCYDELDALRRLAGGKIEECSLMIRMSWDNAIWGAERISADAVGGCAPLRFNFTCATTPGRAIRFFKNGAADGTLSRVTFSTIFADVDTPPPVYGVFDEKFRDSITPYIERLKCTRGEVECRQATKVALKMREELDQQALQMDSEAFRTLSHRSLLQAWLKGSLIYIAQGSWSREIEEYMRWSVQSDLYTKMRLFGKIIDEEQAAERGVGYMPTNLLAKLPMEFTYEEYLSCRRNCGKTGDGKALLRQWLHRHYIVYDDVSHMYKKSEP